MKDQQKPEKLQTLRHPYIRVREESGVVSYGGDQAWLSSPQERAAGCGLIAAADILRYLRDREKTGTGPAGADDLKCGDPLAGAGNTSQTGGFAAGEVELSQTGDFVAKADYLSQIGELALDFPVRNRLGITGFGLAFRMNRIFRREKLPYRAKWSIGKKRLEKRLREMLEEDIPVLFSIGPCFFHRKENLVLYRDCPGGGYDRATSVKDHYVTVTAGTIWEDKTYLQISSWGKKYYICWEEYLDFVRRADNFLFSNILYIRRREDR